MNRKIPPDAFAYYFSLGPNRSYLAVAKHFGVSKQAVTKLAAATKSAPVKKAAQKATGKPAKKTAKKAPVPVSKPAKKSAKKKKK